MRPKKIDTVSTAVSAPQLPRVPRLVKATEFAARVAAKSEQLIRGNGPATAATGQRARRMPRGADEARALFDSLFGGPVEA